jgi:hypothetical protein
MSMAICMCVSMLCLSFGPVYVSNTHQLGEAMAMTSERAVAVAAAGVATASCLNGRLGGGSTTRLSLFQRVGR